MVCTNVYAADTDAEARRLFSSLEQAFVNLRTGRPGKLPPPLEAAQQAELTATYGEALSQLFRYAIVGGPDTVARGIADFVALTQVDELMVTAMIFDHARRLRSFEIVAQTAAGTAS